MAAGLGLAGHSLEGVYSAKTSIVEARYAIVAMYGLIVYEWLASIGEEIRLIHMASWTSIKTLYLLCRYYPFAIWILVIWAYVLDHTEETCSRVTRIVHALLAPCQFFSQAVMLMRAFAFVGRDKRILCLLGTCYVCLVSVDVWVFCTKIEIPSPEYFTIFGGIGCFPNYGDGHIALRIGYSMLAATLMDLVSLVVVVVHCIKSRWARDVPLASYFVQQGLMAFAFASFVNIAAAIAYFKPPRYHTGIGLPLILVTSNLVACRIILQLRAHVYPTETELSRRYSCVVRNAIGSLPEDSWVIGAER